MELFKERPINVRKMSSHLVVNTLRIDYEGKPLQENSSHNTLSAEVCTVVLLVMVQIAIAAHLRVNRDTSGCTSYYI